DGIRAATVTGVQTCALPIYPDSIAGCSFKQYRAHSAERQVCLVFLQQFRANSMPPVRFRDIKSDNMRERRIFFAQDEPDNFRAEIGRASCREKGEGSWGTGS